MVLDVNKILKTTSEGKPKGYGKEKLPCRKNIGLYVELTGGINYRSSTLLNYSCFTHSNSVKVA